jgi:23S rRNA (cytidine1920-2'-O)/16S rRNA (cytidine1409-2'-O)-methyltransferase
MARNTRRLDQLLVERGHAADARSALGLIMSGRVVCEGRVVTKPGHPTRSDAIVHVRGDQLKYASRGGYKLECALRRFGVDVTDRVVLDAGASTGGFTDCLLQSGARRVYAVDVGYGQLRGSLAANPRVQVMERTNISDLSTASFSEPLELAVLDLSYLSLLHAIPIVASCFVGGLRAIALFKPLYEGLARERMQELEALHAVLSEFFTRLGETRFRVRDAIVSPILGGNAAIEFLLQIDAEPGSPPEPGTLADRAIGDCRANPPIAALEA